MVRRQDANLVTIRPLGPSRPESFRDKPRRVVAVHVLTEDVDAQGKTQHTMWNFPMEPRVVRVANGLRIEVIGENAHVSGW